MPKEENRPEISLHLKSLFQDAREENQFEYIYTLVRVQQISRCVPDPMLKLRDLLQATDLAPTEEKILSQYCALSTVKEPLELVANLIHCIAKRPYNPFPFRKQAHFENNAGPSFTEITKELVRTTQETGRPKIVQAIKDAYPEQVLAGCFQNDLLLDSKSVKHAFEKCFLFLKTLVDIYFEERLKYRGSNRFFKGPGRFEVFELLINDEHGLYGFQLHFSNGNSALFARHSDSTECENVRLDVPINFFCGNLDELRDEWRVGEKRLHEIGLPGRYNKLGEWKPIVYPGKTDEIQKEIKSKTKQDAIRGSLFYMFCTGHRVLEFVVRTQIELPTQTSTFGNKIFLWKCPSENEGLGAGQNKYIYDGWVELDSCDQDLIDSIMEAISMVGLYMNTLSLVYDSPVNWRLKYTMKIREPGSAIPNEEDLKIYNTIWERLPRTEDSYYLLAAIDWYNRGLSSRNIFNKFLCHYIAFESLASAIANGKADLGVGYVRKSRAERRQQEMECVQKKHDKLYLSDPVHFVNQAYSDCIEGLAKKTRKVAELVFGPNDIFVKSLFEGQNGDSLYKIRNKIAHGGITFLDRDHEILVGAHCHEIQNISRAFLIRIILNLKPTDSLPKLSGTRRLALSTADPRNTLVCSDLKIIPNTDWRIRPEWCD